ncbi:MAG: hypothetical protein ACYSW0_18435 [Planctomycetota bacterium]|jgi:hypothetical protein
MIIHSGKKGSRRHVEIEYNGLPDADARFEARGIINVRDCGEKVLSRAFYGRQYKTLKAAERASRKWLAQD